MVPPIAHGSGIDEILLFLAAPVLFLLFHGFRRLRGHRRTTTPESDLPEHRDVKKGM